MSEDKISPEGQRLSQAFLMHQAKVKRAEVELARAKKDLQEITMLFAKWMLPDDARAGEKIGCWQGDWLFTAWYDDQIENLGQLDKPLYNVVVRTRGRSRDLLEAELPGYKQSI